MVVVFHVVVVLNDVLGIIVVVVLGLVVVGIVVIVVVINVGPRNLTLKFGPNCST